MKTAQITAATPSAEIDNITEQSPRKGYSTTTLTLVIALYCAVVLNRGFFSQIVQSHVGEGLLHYLFLVSAFVFALALINGLISLLAFRFVFKTWLILILLSGSAANYFINSYNVVLDYTMVQNIFETDWREALELLNWPLFGNFLLFGVLPSVMVARTPVRYGSWLREILNKGVTIVVTLLLIAIVALVFYQDYASLFRNNRKLKNYLVPTGYVYSLFIYGKEKVVTHNKTLVPLGKDAHLGAYWSQPEPRKTVVIMVVGETARAANFSLNGYERDTNPRLQQEDVIYFNDVHSCGTSTAASLPCMFSNKGRRDFDGSEGAYTENLLDVVKHAGLDVLWRDNNSGCKGLCKRVEFEDLSRDKQPDLCNTSECFDMVLLQSLEQRIDSMGNPALIILHQKGSHGPAYYQRAPKEFQRFTPVCHTNQLQQCTQAEIVNAYDNTILYTDYVLAELIEALKKNSDRFDSAMLYVSDHGESLSESNLYLHGLPYAIAPEQQTHVPMLMWLSDGYLQHRGIDKNCLQAQRTTAYTHDNLFDSVLDMLNVETSLFRPEMSILNNCHNN